MCGVCLCYLFPSRRRHTRCALVTGVQTCALPILGTTFFVRHSPLHHPGTVPEMMEAALNYPDHSHPVDTRKASLIAGVAEKTLENLRHIGGGPRYIKLGRKVMYDPRDIEAWKEARKIPSTSAQVAEIGEAPVKT